MGSEADGVRRGVGTVITRAGGEVLAGGATSARRPSGDALVGRLDALVQEFLDSPRLTQGDPLRAGLEYYLEQAVSRRDFDPWRLQQRLDDAVTRRDTNTAECMVYALQGLAVLEAHPRGTAMLGGRSWMLDPKRNGFRAQLQNPDSDPQAYEKRRNDFDRQVAHDAAWAVLQTLRMLPRT